MVRSRQSFLMWLLFFWTLIEMLIDLPSIDTQSIFDWHLGWHLIDILVATNFCRHSIECWAINTSWLSLLTDWLSVECWSRHWSSVDLVWAKNQLRCPSRIDWVVDCGHWLILGCGCLYYTWSNKITSWIFLILQKLILFWLISFGANPFIANSLLTIYGFFRCIRTDFLAVYWLQLYPTALIDNLVHELTNTCT